MLIAWTTGVKCLDAIIEAEGHDRVFGLFLPLFLNPVSPSLGISQQRTCIFDFCRGFRDEVSVSLFSLVSDPSSGPPEVLDYSWYWNPWWHQCQAAVARALPKNS